MNSRRNFLGALCLPAVLAASPAWVMAQTSAAPDAASVRAQKLTNFIHLAYVRTSSAAINSNAQAGLEALAAEVAARHTIDARGAVGLDLEQDDLSYHRFLYWPVTADTKPLSKKAAERVQKYIDKGGMILFDLRDQGARRALLQLQDGLTIGPLEKVTGESILANQFYKLAAGLPGSVAYGDLSAEVPDAGAGGKSTSVVIGDRNWGDAWAGKTVSRGSRDYDMAMRSGLNMLIYAYTGKSNPIPVLKILEEIKPK